MIKPTEVLMKLKIFLWLFNFEQLYFNVILTLEQEMML